MGQSHPSARATLDPDSDLNVVSWNVHKLLHDGIHEELSIMVEERDLSILALQEARLGMPIPYGMCGHHAHSFRSGLSAALPALLGSGTATREGVMTLSSVPPTRAHRFRSAQRELLVLTPKAALVSYFPMADGRELSFVNLHGLNFDPTGRQLVKQLSDLGERLEHLTGPLIVAGDFNTWNEPRMNAVEELACSLDLVEVKPDYPGGKTGEIPHAPVAKVLGFQPELHLDRIFVRGFRPVQVSWMMDFQASDHVPLFARLAWK